MIICGSYLQINNIIDDDNHSAPGKEPRAGLLSERMTRELSNGFRKQGNRGQSALSRPAACLRGRPIFAGPTRRWSWSSIISLNRMRSCLILGAVGLVILGLMAWAAIAILSWLWGQAPTVTEAGKRLTGGAVTQIEQVAPGLKKQAEQWLSGLRKQAAPWLPGAAPALPASDVSGTDVGPVPRCPGRTRSHFARAGQTVEVRYAGPAAFAKVLAYYVRGFATAGCTQEVVSATSQGQQHRFGRGQKSIDLSLLRRPGRLLKVRLKLSPP